MGPGGHPAHSVTLRKGDKGPQRGFSKTLTFLLGNYQTTTHAPGNRYDQKMNDAGSGSPFLHQGALSLLAEGWPGPARAAKYEIG